MCCIFSEFSFVLIMHIVHKHFFLNHENSKIQVLQVIKTKSFLTLCRNSIHFFIDLNHHVDINNYGFCNLCDSSLPLELEASQSKDLVYQWLNDDRCYKVRLYYIDKIYKEWKWKHINYRKSFFFIHLLSCFNNFIIL